jgi:glucose/arabinose dehydrogenase
MDVAFLGDGSMLVSDDFAGAIWRITDNPPPAQECSVP